jgi:hypothetical protein
MKKPGSGRRASASRPARRSLVEFTTPAAADPAAIPLSPVAGKPRAPSADTAPPVERKGEARDDGRRIADAPAERRVIAKPRSAQAGEKINNAMVEDDAMRPIEKNDDVQEDASAAAEAAKAYRSAMFEHMKANLNATLDYANGLASIPTEVASRAADKAHLGGAGLRENIPTATKAAEDYRAKAFELMKANVNATLEFGQSLAKAKSPAEFVELSTNHACKQLGMILNQTNELVLMAQTMATANVQRMAAGFAKVISGKKE